MAKLKLTLACNGYDRCRALFDRRVEPEGIELDLKLLKPRELFPRMLDHQEFDVAELSLGSYATLVARAASPFVAIPVPLSKIFRHSCIYVREGAGIAGPQNLKGKRVGTTQYGATAIVTIKGLLNDEYGVAPRDMRWFVGGLNTPTETPLIPLHLPKDVELEFLGPERTLEAMLERGELDALFSIYIPKLFLEGSPLIARLFPDFRRAEEDYYRRTRIFPIMHVVVIKKEVYAREPWIADSLYTAFCRARDLALETLYDTDALMVTLPWLLDDIEESRRLLGKNFWAYGLEPNRPALMALARWIAEQGLAPRIVAPEELFVPVRE
ncbi:MAG TPA: ABC transporter substrate-binding protein [Micropepsaceae bacterium]|nr:ABC transporter substrate-binding protein [Micropepsaceae bacterium]